MKISKELVQKIANYLNNCPYRDVAVMLAELAREIKPIESEEPDVEAKRQD